MRARGRRWSLGGASRHRARRLQRLPGAEARLRSPRLTSPGRAGAAVGRKGWGDQVTSTCVCGEAGWGQPRRDAGIEAVTR